MSYDRIEEKLAKLIRLYAEGAKQDLLAKGAVRDVRFRGVGGDDFDVYEHTRENGRRDRRRRLAPDGEIDGLAYAPAP